MACKIHFTLLFFALFIALCVGENRELFSKTISGYDDGTRSQKYSYITIDAENFAEPETNIERESKRSILQQPAEILQKINHLNVTHQQLLIGWTGDESDIIICVARDQPDNKLHTSSSAVFISYDSGDSFSDKTQLFSFRELHSKRIANIDRFYIHPKYNSHILFTDSANKVIFTTSNHGRNVMCHELNFHPSDIAFHDTNPFIYISLDKTDPERKLWLTMDFGVHWKVLQMHVKSYYFNFIQGVEMLYIEREEIDGNGTIILLAGLKTERPYSEILYEGDIQDFLVLGNFMFLTKRNEDSHDLYISHKRGLFNKARFDTNLKRLAYHVADVSNGQIMLAVCHTEMLVNLYVSKDTSEFKLSLTNMFAFFPKYTWKDSWLQNVTHETFIDLYKVEGLNNIYIASKITAEPVRGNIGPEHLVSVITYNYGIEWKLISPPKYNYEEQLINCSFANNCSLQLSQQFGKLFPDTQFTSIKSSKSAPGLIIATGIVGTNSSGLPGVYISQDAGLTWIQSFKENYLFDFGDHGGVLVAVKSFQHESNKIYYSTDEGINWSYTLLGDRNFKFHELITNPNKTTSSFVIFGSEKGYHRWVATKIDLKNAFEGPCKPSDYEFWSLNNSSDENTRIPCTLGKKHIYQRRLPQSSCYNGKYYERPIKIEVCECNIEDFECDFGFIHSRLSPYCIRNKSISFDPYMIPLQCKSGMFYNRTKGYRKIAADVCAGGYADLYLPEKLRCPIDDTEEFMVVASIDKILKIDLKTKDRQVIPVPKLHNVITVEYDIRNNCLYWADYNKGIISRQCFLNGTNTTEILIDSKIGSIEGLAFDWISNVLYFIDASNTKIEIIQTDTSPSQRMTTTILNSEHLKSPRGIAVHPKAGFLFWTDWNEKNPSVNRANLDGTFIRHLAKRPQVIWPNSITIDYIAERIYWVDARNDYVASSDLNGKDFHKVSVGINTISHPFSIGILKNNIYWVDWNTRSIFSADKDDGEGTQTFVSSVQRLMNIKIVAYGIHEGTNACSNKNKSVCSHICLGAPKGGYSCLCPHGLHMSDGICTCPKGNKPYHNHTCPQENICLPEQFRCKNGRCVSKDVKCDGDNNCGDFSDENECNSKTCPSGMFQCRDGKCIPTAWKCDLNKNCADGSDEEDCINQTCKESEFTCKNGQCISDDQKCDGKENCRDGSDEVNCSANTCGTNMFMCSDGRCISLNWNCDGDLDCIDGSDELNCGNKTCSETQFTCNNGFCILSGWKCDGEYDCSDRSDEINCEKKTCKPGTFVCGDGKCIPIVWKCDSSNDCIDGSDEFECKYATCSNEQFSCTDGKCISRAWRCDGDNDCMDNSDEIDCDITTCRSSEFTCVSNRRCIPNRWKCDGDVDCSDSSDEKYCELDKCDAITEFTCKNGSCINKMLVCNGNNDCHDRTDEINCTQSINIENSTISTTNVPCNDSMFTCDNNRCIPQQLRCNGKNDCKDGSDEKNCKSTITISTTRQPPSRVCRDEEFQCSGTCIPQVWLCDGDKDCVNGEDEVNCRNVTRS